VRAREHAVSNDESEIDTNQVDPPAIRGFSEGVFAALLFAGILVSPIPMGANRDWAWSPLAVFFGALAVWQALGLGTPRQAVRPGERWFLFALVCCFLAVVLMAVLQLSPLVPSSWYSNLYARAATALDRPVSGLVTLNADASRAILMKIGACGAVFVMARATLADARRARLFLLLLVAAAVVVTSYGVLMHATNGSCYVLNYNKRPEETPEGRHFLCSLSGTFINSNSYAAYAGMAIVATFGLMLGRQANRADHQDRGLATAPAAVWLTGTRMFCLAASLFLFGGLLLANSRAGFAATIVGCFLLSLLLLRGRWPSSPFAAWTIAGGIVVVAVVTIVAGSAMFTKIGAFSDDDLLKRFRMWQIAFSALGQSPWLGWGLGTFPDVYTMLQPSDLQVANDKAHSTPLEWLEDLGIPGGLCAFGTVLVPLVVCLRGSLRRRTNRYLPAVALTASLVPILHSFVDFSLQIPAIGLTVSALLGLGWAHAFRRYE
jgi:O-antigen ligase